MAPGIDKLYSTNSWQGEHKVNKVVQLGLSTNLHESPGLLLNFSCLLALAFLSYSFLLLFCFVLFIHSFYWVDLCYVNCSQMIHNLAHFCPRIMIDGDTAIQVLGLGRADNIYVRRQSMLIFMG